MKTTTKYIALNQVTPECACVYQGKTYDFCYTNPQNRSLLGTKFDCSHGKVLEDLDLLNHPSNLITLEESFKNVQDVVFVSAATNDHLMYTLDSFKTIRKYYPNHRYVFYGLNLDGPNVLRLPKDPNFEFRRFNTTPYPQYVNNFPGYHFKSLVLAEALLDFPLVFWIDAHKGVHLPGLLEGLFVNTLKSRMSKDYSSITAFIGTGHSNFAVLHPDLLDFFPTTCIEDLKTEQQVGSGFIFVPRTRETLEILKWWVLCSLTEKCINPVGHKLRCNFDTDRFNIHAKCFRYDQSVLNLLLLNKYREHKKYYLRVMGEHVLRMTTIIRVFLVLLLFGIIAILHLQLVQNVGTKLRPIDNFAEIQNLRLHPECTCVYNKKNYSFCYTDPQNKSSLGRKFNCSYAKVLEDLNLLNTPENLITLKESIKNIQDVVFVSAATDDHLMYTLESFKTIRKYYPNHRYVFYGLNLNEPPQFQNDSNFEFRKFNTTPYPNYVNNFPRYHFKGLVLAEALRDFPVVFWIDAHQIIRKNGMLESLFRNISESRLEEGFSSITSFVPTPHSNFAVLNQDLLKFFPSNSMNLLKKEEQVGSGIIFVPRTIETMEILKWWVLCSLTDECINPAGARLACNFKEDQFNISASCFRFDQSVLNLLLLNKYQNYNKYFIRSMVQYFY
ncbi:hypothetical protein CAEBREN_28858 [Caenorhabditis brenneri]|uniref:Uncharacterized protein n=1 Tax=Caenorhabditis brenneri TaxID=135651 RepID=G0PIE0_CAEBE|nr:hypothetical protein CAEBREN_28858 [Caenorhabditis brenneri]